MFFLGNKCLLLLICFFFPREVYQKVEGKTNSEFDFLGDPYIISNKPYIGKFFGTLVQFQILEYFQNEVSDGVNILTHMAQDENFK